MSESISLQITHNMQLNPWNNLDKDSVDNHSNQETLTQSNTNDSSAFLLGADESNISSQKQKRRVSFHQDSDGHGDCTLSIQPIGQCKQDDDGENENELATLPEHTGEACIPIPQFIQSMLSTKHHNEITSNSVRDVAEKLSTEHESVENVVSGVEKMKDIWVGNVGLALFFPFDFNFFSSAEKDENNHFSHDSNIITDELDLSGTSLDSGYDFDEIMLDYESDMEQNPPILSNIQMKEIKRKGLPPSIQLMTWKRAYSLSRDGDYFGTMLGKCLGFQHTLVVIKTKKGDILGGYADTPWGDQKGSKSLQRTPSFFGNGRAFLFATAPDLNEKETELLSQDRLTNDSIFIFNWTGKNEYNQICDKERGSFGMGGGGDFGWFVERDFTIGSSGRCQTFQNPPLTKDDNNTFIITDLEVYGFSSMSERLGFLSPQNSRSSFSSYGRKSSYCSSSSSVVSLLE